MTPAVPGSEGFLDPLAETAALVDEGRAAEALERCERLIAAGRGSALTRTAHGRVLMSMGRAGDAVVALREAAQLSPGTAEILLAFGEALAAVGTLPAAIGELQRAARLAPDDVRPQLAIARLWLEAGEAEKGLAALEVALATGAVGDDVAAAIRARAHDMQRQARADAGYVRHLFDQFAADYDERMRARLGYAAPQILRQLALMLTDPGQRHAILDLGCGTGLSGLAFQDLARSLTGVDLSPRMLEKARATGAYTALVEGDIVNLPSVLDGPFDIIVAADVLVYLGDLEALFASTRRRLAPDGLWLFTTELGEALDHELGPKRRYRHSDAYLRRLAERHGLDVCSLVESVCRHEAGVPVRSWAVALRAA
jgi:predicted TPR repeat methyltransferase